MFTGVKIFSATMVADRERLGERVTEWIASRPKGFKLVDIVVTQSSDDAFHMIAMTVFYSEPGRPSISHIVKRPDGIVAPRRLSFKRDE